MNILTTTEAVCKEFTIPANNVDLTGVTVTFTIPSDLTVDSTTLSQGTFSGSVWDVGTVSAGIAPTIELCVIQSSAATCATSTIIEATIDADGDDPDPDNNTASATLDYITCCDLSDCQSTFIESTCYDAPEQTLTCDFTDVAETSLKWTPSEDVTLASFSMFASISADDAPSMSINDGVTVVASSTNTVALTSSVVEATWGFSNEVLTAGTTYTFTFSAGDVSVCSASQAPSGDFVIQPGVSPSFTKDPLVAANTAVVSTIPAATYSVVTVDNNGVSETYAINVADATDTPDISGGIPDTWTVCATETELTFYNVLGNGFELGITTGLDVIDGQEEGTPYFVLEGQADPDSLGVPVFNFRTRYTFFPNISGELVLRSEVTSGTSAEVFRIEPQTIFDTEPSIDPAVSVNTIIAEDENLTSVEAVRTLISNTIDAGTEAVATVAGAFTINHDLGVIPEAVNLTIVSDSTGAATAYWNQASTTNTVIHGVLYTSAGAAVADSSYTVSWMAITS